MHSKLLQACILLLVLVTASCDNLRVVDENRELANRQWHYKQPMVFNVPIESTDKLYNIFLNLRVDNEYKYSNFFALVNQINPDKTEQSKRIEVTLANAEGKWLGNGLGNIFDYRQPIATKVKFNEPGVYTFSMVQNMRDDTLMHVVSAGLRVEEAR